MRTVLAEKQLPYRSNELITPSNAGMGGHTGVADNYKPGYVRLRIYGGGESRMNNLSTSHSLRTSTQSEGFDACVVPTLVDHETRRVVVDSYEICAYLDQAVADHPLVPGDAAKENDVMEQVRLVDTTPHPGFLYAFHKDDPRPDFLRKAMTGIYDRKIDMLKRMIDEVDDDPQLVRAYRAKIEREEGGRELQYDDTYHHRIMDEFRALISNLDQQLSSHDGPWVCGRAFTLADCCWGISLFRMHWAGRAFLWADAPNVKDYAFRCYSRPSILASTLRWPSPAPPSQHTSDIPELQEA